ncbi:MAG: winged helix-turn-helix domain-containing protein [Chitinispirillaceae bacterium]|jgi:hypothetical protein
MLEGLFGSACREKTLLFLFARQEGYAREIARFFNTGLDPVQKQLERLEFGGVVYGRPAGKTRLYSFNPRYPFLKELKSLLEKAISLYPEEERDKLTMVRRRPRRKGKPL